MITDLRNGLRYIGKHNGKRNNYFTGSKIINASIKKRGEESRDKNFKKEILSQGNFNTVLLNELEKHFIRLYNTIQPYGYNILEGGVIKPKPEYTAKAQAASPIKKGFSPWNKGTVGISTGGWPVGAKRPKSLGEKESATKKAKYASGEIVAWNKGRKCTEEEKRQIMMQHPNRKPVGQFTKDGQLVKVFNSCGEAERMTGISQANISKKASGQVNWFFGGYDWRYINNDN